MDLTASLFEMRIIVASHSALLAVAAVAGSGSAVALLAGPLFRLRPFGVREHESIMNFSSLGTLRCICGAENGKEEVVDRRQFCRACGCEVVAANAKGLDQLLTRAEIKQRTRTLREAAIRARYRELPPSITSITELNRYLADCKPVSGHGRAAFTAPIEQSHHN